MSPVASILGPCLVPLLLAVEPEGRAERKPDAMIISMKTGETHLEPHRVSMGRARRFLQLTRASSSGRFRSIERVSGGSAALDLQYQAALLGRAAIDARGKLGIGFGVFTGRGFTGGWNRIAGARGTQGISELLGWSWATR